MPALRPTPFQLAGKTLARVRARGPAELASLWQARLRENFASTKTLIVLTRSTSPLEGDGAPSKGLSLIEATPAHGRRYARDIGTDSAATFAGRLSGGTGCFLVESAEHDRKIVHATWMTTRAAWVREVRRYFLPPPGDAYVFESFTRVDERGHGVYPFALRSMCSCLRERAIGRVWVAIEAGNPGSLNAVSKAGFEIAFEVRYRRLLGTLHLDAVEGSALAPDWRFLSDRA